MAQGTKQERENRETGLERRSQGGMQNRGMSTWEPFSMLDNFRNEMDRLFQDFGFGGGLAFPNFRGFTGETYNWIPQTEIFKRDNELVVRADLPGLNKEDVDVDIDNDVITIHGERKSEHEENKEGLYRTERSYGSFYRSIPLPQGANGEQAKAKFNNGVLEIILPIDEQKTQGRKIDIT